MLKLVFLFSRFKDVGFWDTPSFENQSNFYLKEQIFPDLLELYSDFKGRVLTVSPTSNDWPFFEVKVLENGTKVPNTGIDVALTDCLAEFLNFR